jgi:protein TonB
MSRRAFILGLFISLFLHVALLVSVQFWPRSTPPKKEEIEVSLIEPPTKTSKDDQLKQIVDQSEKSINDETPKDAKYMSRNNQRVEKETKAQQQGKFINQDNGSPSPAQQARTTPPKPSSNEPKPTAKGPGNLPKLKDLRPNLDWSREALAAKQGQGPSQTDDFVKDTTDGPQTLLNTREFIYFTYYARIKDRLRQYWEPKIKDKVQRLLAQGRTIASNQERITKIIITLDNKGTLIKVQVIGESGIHDLDDAAVEAFRLAAPFPHPPAGIIDSDGTIKIRWDFVLEANNSLLQVDRYAQSNDE